MALRDDGRVQGSVSGGCIEDDLVARMQDGRIAGSQPFVLTYGVTRDEAARFGLPCGGTLELVVEPAPDMPAGRSGRPHRGRAAGAAGGGHRLGAVTRDACRGEALGGTGSASPRSTARAGAC
jgi:xanthine dehydrogenase accessory factor